MVKTHRYLGVHFNQRMDWTDHIRRLKGRMYHQTNHIRYLAKTTRSKLTMPILQRLYRASYFAIELVEWCTQTPDIWHRVRMQVLKIWLRSKVASQQEDDSVLKEAYHLSKGSRTRSWPKSGFVNATAMWQNMNKRKQMPIAQVLGPKYVKTHTQEIEKMEKQQQAGRIDSITHIRKAPGYRIRHSEVLASLTKKPHAIIWKSLKGKNGEQ